MYQSNSHDRYTFPEDVPRSSDAVAREKVEHLTQIADKEKVPRRNVILVDDNIKNCKAIRDAKFVAIHVPIGGINQDIIDALKDAIES